MTATFVALLRGVNVGGANRLTMAALRAAFESAGGREVETLMQSGNVVFSAPADQGEAIVGRVRAAVARDLAIESPIVLRDADSWRRLVAGNPFLADGANPEVQHAICLSTPPGAEAVARIESSRAQHEAFAMVGANVYLKLSNGVARSKLANVWLDARIGVVATMRNWRTVTKLAALIDARR